MTPPPSNPEAFWDSLLDSLDDYLETIQDAAKLPQGDKDRNYICKPSRNDRSGGQHGVSKDGGLPGRVRQRFPRCLDDETWATVRRDQAGSELP